MSDKRSRITIFGINTDIQFHNTEVIAKVKIKPNLQSPVQEARV